MAMTSVPLLQQLRGSLAAPFSLGRKGLIYGHQREA